MTRVIDLSGRNFGGLRVLRRGPARTWTRQANWICRCGGCGRDTEVLSADLRSGRVRSCGLPGCRGAFPVPGPAETLADNCPADALGTTVALLRASVDDDHHGIAAVMRGLDEDDDLIGITLQLLRLCSTALVQAEGSTVAAHRVVDSLAKYDRQTT